MPDSDRIMWLVACIASVSACIALVAGLLMGYIIGSR